MDEQRIQKQIAIYMTDKKLCEFNDKLKLAPVDYYAHVHAQGEQPHPHHQQHRAKEEQHHGARCQGGNGDADDQHNGCNGQHRGKGLSGLFV